MKLSAAVNWNPLVHGQTATADTGQASSHDSLVDFYFASCYAERRFTPS